MQSILAVDDSNSMRQIVCFTLRSAGYDVVYKGKWHMSNGARGADGEYEYDDISRYGFDSWNPPDGGIERITSHGTVAVIDTGVSEISGAVTLLT